MHKPFNSVRFVDALAEITRHDDREVIERSLLQTLGEMKNSSEYWLYQVMTYKPEVCLGLLAYSARTNIVTSNHPIKKPPPEIISKAIKDAIEEVSVKTIHTQDASSHVYNIYPAEDQSNDVFAILVEKTFEPDLETQRLVHSFLKVYANYLRLLEQIRRDKLTGVLNRETLESEITRIIILNNENVPHDNNNPEFQDEQRIDKGELSYWAGVLDIDHFKKINDTFGHLYGDEILILVARLMEKSIRDYDLIFRYGGEEFVILLKASGLEDAKNAFERIRMMIGNHEYAKLDRVNVSIGVTQISSQAGPASVITEADEALYYAKEHGRNQIRIYSELLEDGLIETASEDNIKTGGINYF